MAVMNATERLRARNQVMRLITSTLDVTKPQLAAAVDATDDFIDTNAAGYNSALPIAARNGLTATQKTLLFCYVAMRRAGILRAEEDA